MGTYLLSIAVLGACDDPRLSSLSGRIGISGVADEDSQWVLDFGATDIGTTSERTLLVENWGSSSTRALVSTPGAPFDVSVSSVLLQVHGADEVVVTFSPELEGPATAWVEFSAGESLERVMLRGLGRRRPSAAPEPPGPGTEEPEQDCTYRVDPLTIDFGDVPRSKAVFGRVRVLGSGSVGCPEVTVALHSDSAPEFSEVTWGPSAQSGEVAAFTVRFMGFEYGSYGGEVIVAQTDGSTTRIPLSARVLDPCAEPAGCTFSPPEHVAYANTATALWALDLVTRTASYVATFTATDAQPLADIADIAIDGQGRLFAIDAGGTLYRVDPGSGACHYVGYVAGNPAGLGVLADGTLVAAGRDLRLVSSVDGSLIDLLVPEGIFQTSGDVTLASDGTLLWTLHGDGGDGLVRVDPVTKQRTVISASIEAASVWGLMSAGNSILGVTRHGLLLTMDPSSGAILASEAIPGEWRGAATAQ